LRIIDLHCYPNTEPWIKSQGPYVEALAKYWDRAWGGKTEKGLARTFLTVTLRMITKSYCFTPQRAQPVSSLLTLSPHAIDRSSAEG
jgi:hypothetical protein